MVQRNPTEPPESGRYSMKGLQRMERKRTVKLLELPLWTRSFVSTVPLFLTVCSGGGNSIQELQGIEVQLQTKFPQLVNGRAKV